MKGFCLKIVQVSELGGFFYSDASKILFPMI